MAATMEAANFLKAEIEKRQFISTWSKYEWILTVFYIYLTACFDKEKLTKAIKLADESIGRDKIAIGVN